MEDRSHWGHRALADDGGDADHGTMSNPPAIHRPLHPFSMQIDLLDRMLNFEIADDPHYSGLEIQGFDDPQHGKGMLVLLSRRDDGKTDVYYEHGLELDPASYAIGAGLGEWAEAEFAEARLEVAAAGVRADVSFSDLAGRSIEIRIGDRTPRGRRTASFLAPMGAEIAEPRSLPLVWMSGFDLLRRRGPAPVVRIDGREASIGRLPAEWLLRRRLVKVTSDLCVVALNPEHSDPVSLDHLEVGGESFSSEGGTTAVVAGKGGHSARFEFDPPFPDLGKPGPDAGDEGSWRVAVDGIRLVSGVWRVQPDGGDTRVDLDVTEGWKPRRLPWLMSVVTRLADVFRTWPTTYRWTATVSQDGGPVMTSKWERTTDDRAESYRSLTRSR